ncbi:MAG: TolC family protein [Acidobacteriota bacterium]
MRRLLAAVLLTAGCASTADLPPPIEPDAGLRESWAQPLPGNGETLLSLSGLVDDPRFAALVDRALEGNPDLIETALRLRESGVLLAVPEAQRLPQIEAASSQARGTEPGGGSSPSSTSSLSLNLSWEVDVWGRLADRLNEAELRHRALEQDLQAARNSLAARTLQAGLRRILRDRQLGIERRRLFSLESTLEAVRGRYRSGLGAVTDWDASRSELAAAEAEVERLEEEVRRADRDLSLLLGDLALEPKPPLPERLPKVAPTLAPVPAEVLAARPDVAAALLRLEAEGAAVRVARKALLPSFSLTADLALSSQSAADVLRADPVWSVLGSLAAALIRRRALHAELNAARLRDRASTAAYRGVLLDAVVEVENALGAEHSLSRRLPHLETSLEHAVLSRRSFEGQFARGLANILDLLTAQRIAFDSEVRLLEARFDLLENRIELGLVLGLEAS